MRRFALDDAAAMVYTGELVNAISVAGILAAHAMSDIGSLRAADAPWRDRPAAFARRKGRL